jgi:transcription initiation factor TFIIH subunit 2
VVALKTKIKMAFERLIRFENEKGDVVYGNLEKETPTKEIEGSIVEVIDGSIEKGFSKTTQKATVKKVSYLLSIPFNQLTPKQLLCPIPSAHLIICIGINYHQHAQEASVSP